MATAITVTVDAVNYMFTPDSVQQDAVRFGEASSTLVLPRTLMLRRVYPKKQKDYPGNARNNLKTTRTVLLNDGTTAAGIIFDTSVSRRADVAVADFLLARKIHAALLQDSELDGFFSTLAL